VGFIFVALARVLEQLFKRAVVHAIRISRENGSRLRAPARRPASRASEAPLKLDEQLESEAQKRR
jgi:hypothetical protein